MGAPQHACLNCGAKLISKYCHDCGQKSDTHRISLPHLIKHDLVHGVWHFDKGLLYTAREAFLRPGHMAMDYIKGKRVRYYNVFYLILIVLGINLLASRLFRMYYHIADDTTTKGLVINQDSVDVSYYVQHYFKLLLFLLIPLFAVSGWISFRKLKLNFAEHALIAANVLLAGAMWHFFVIVGMYITTPFESQVFLDYLVGGLLAVSWLQPVRVYYQAARKTYTLGGFILRIVQWYSFLALQLFIILLLIAACTGKTNITLS